jgi:DNA-binding beta-propeller fold protein YncE
MKWIAPLALLLFAGPLLAQEKHEPPPIPYHVVENFLQFPDNIYMAEAVGVSLDSKGNIYVVNRGNHPLLEFDPNGKFLRSVADGHPMFVGPHMVRIDPEDNIWYIDAGSNVVVKLDPQWRLQMVLGRRPEEWTWLTHVVEHAAAPPQNFNQPTDVTWGPDGSIYVTDGYGNSRVAKFNSHGILVKYWGDRGTEPGQFNTPHSIVMDAKGNLYVADRGNSRIQVFDTDGKLLQVWRNFGGPPWSICITPGPKQVLFVGSIGRIFKMDLNGNVLGTIGKPGKLPGEMEWVHGVACPDEHTVYAAEELTWRVDKLVLEH